MTNSTDEYWDVDGVSLQTYAWNLRSWGGSRHGAPPMRGADVIIPGRDGRFRVVKEVDSRTVELDGWVVGADENGVVKDVQGFRSNWRRLLRLLFNKGRVVNLTRRWMERVPVPVRRNLVTNSEPVGPVGSTPAGWRQVDVAENQMQIVQDGGALAIQMSRGPLRSFYIDPMGPDAGLRFDTVPGDRWRLRAEIKVLKPINMRVYSALYNAAAGGLGAISGYNQIMWPSDGWKTLETMGEVTNPLAASSRHLIWPIDTGVPINLAPNRDFVDDANVFVNLLSKAVDSTISSSPATSLALTVLANASPTNTYVEERAIPCSPNRWVGLGIDVSVKTGSRWFAPRVTFLDSAGVVLARGPLVYREVHTTEGAFERLVTSAQAPAGTVTANVQLFIQDVGGVAAAAGSVFNTDSWNAVVTVTQADAMFQAAEFIPDVQGPLYRVRRVLLEKSTNGEPFEGVYFYGGTPADGDTTYGYEGAAGASVSVQYEPGYQAVSATAKAELLDGADPSSTGPQRATFNASMFLADPWFYGAEILETFTVGASRAVTVPGDAATSAVVLELVGPLTTPVLTVNGVTLRYATVPAGSIARVDAGEFTATETSGSTTINTLGRVVGSQTGPWITLQPGANQISLAGAGAGSARLKYRPKWL